MKRIIVTIVASSILLAGCKYNATSQDIARFSSGPPHQIDIKIGSRLASLTDRCQYMTDSISFPTGQMASRVFTGKDGCEWGIELLSSQLTVESRDEFPLPVFHTTATYH
jgi:hypothetical protein